MQANKNTAKVKIEKSVNTLNVILEGNILQYQSEESLTALFSYLKSDDIKTLSFLDNGLKLWDSTLLLLIFNGIKAAKERHIAYHIGDLPTNLQNMINLAFAVNPKQPQRLTVTNDFFESFGKSCVNMWQILANALTFSKKVLRSFGRFCRGKSIMRQTDFLSSLNDCGPKALGIVSLVSFLVGLILAFVGAVQLKEFGAQIYVASLVTIGMCRIMGAIMVGVIMAGRTGSAYAATIGTMQVNEELDALKTMGLSRTDFLVLPRLLALLSAMPILTMLADFAGMLGGAFIGIFMMNLPYTEYWKYAFKAFNLSNFLVGIFHGVCFGFIIALCGCYQGLNCGRNADSVGIATTRSVVYSIVLMIVATGIITLVCLELGI